MYILSSSLIQKLPYTLIAVQAIKKSERYPLLQESKHLYIDLLNKEKNQVTDWDVVPDEYLKKHTSPLFHFEDVYIGSLIRKLIVGERMKSKETSLLVSKNDVAIEPSFDTVEDSVISFINIPKLYTRLNESMVYNPMVLSDDHVAYHGLTANDLLVVHDSLSLKNNKK